MSHFSSVPHRTQVASAGQGCENVSFTNTLETNSAPYLDKNQGRIDT
jgi:hypothetical protein